MAEIRPFHGVRYNPDRVGDIARVICPPYDVISPGLQEELYGRSEFNFVRLEYARETGGDSASGSRYDRAAKTLADWLSNGVLKSDSAPSLYLHDHYFLFQGREYRRRGLVCTVKLEGWERGTVRPHEGTLAQPKSDRMSLLRALKANTSPVFMLYPDKESTIAALLVRQEQEPPLFDIAVGTGERHRLWAITDTDPINRIRDFFRGTPLYIADGHHRYESALLYAREMRPAAASPEEEAYDFVLTTMVNFADPGLVVLPTHRLVRGVAQDVLEGIPARLERHFDIMQVPLDNGGTERQLDALLAEEPGNVKLIIAGLSEGNILVLSLRNFASVAEMLPASRTDIYRKLDVSVLDHVILEKLLGLGFEREEASLAYCHDKVEAVNRVASGEFQLAFLLNAVKAEVIKDIADAGDRMPRKSTYFHPKLPSGLVLYRHC